MCGIVALCIFFTLVCSWMAWKRAKFCMIVGKIPGPLALPIVGNVLQFKRESHEFLLQVMAWCEEYHNGVFCVWLGTVPFVVIYKPEYVQVMLAHQKNIVKSPVYKSLQPWLGTGLLTRILNDFISVYQRQSVTLIERLKEKAGKGEIDIAPYIRLCVLDIICDAAMGVHVSAQFDSDSKYVQTVLSMSELVQERQKTPWLWTDVVYNLTSSGRKHQSALNILHGFTNKVINDRINERKQLKENDSSEKSTKFLPRKGRYLAFLDLLLEEYDQGHISREGVREEVDTFMFEGHDTTSVSLLWTLHLVGKNPDVQTKLQKEVDSFYDSVDDVISIENLKDLNYLECVLKEGLRLFPSVPLLGREVTEDYNFGPYQIPKGCSTIIATEALHRNPDVWPDPDTFNPERFKFENCKGRHPFAYVPFSAGPRNCIGQKFAMMEEKIVLSAILRHFNIHSTQTTADIKRSGELILRSIEGIWVKLELRQK